MVDIFKEDLPPVLTPAGTALRQLSRRQSQTLEDIDKRIVPKLTQRRRCSRHGLRGYSIAPAVPVPAPEVEEPAPTPVEQAVEEQAAPVSPTPYIARSSVASNRASTSRFLSAAATATASNFPRNIATSRAARADIWHATSRSTSRQHQLRPQIEPV